MKKLFYKILVCMACIMSVPVAFADVSNTWSTDSSARPDNQNSTKVVVTEAIPWADCELDTDSGSWVAERRYKCNVQGGFGSVVSMIGALIRYVTYITALIWVLMFVGTGIAYMFGEWDAKKQTKERLVQVVTGLIFLFLIAFILNTLAPWIYR